MSSLQSVTGQPKKRVNLMRKYMYCAFHRKASCMGKKLKKMMENRENDVLFTVLVHTHLNYRNCQSNKQWHCLFAWTQKNVISYSTQSCSLGSPCVLLPCKMLCAGSLMMANVSGCTSSLHDSTRLHPNFFTLHESEQLTWKIDRRLKV